MDQYVKNSACSCARCRSSRLFGPAMMITVGVLFLFDQNGFVDFDRSWPVILLVAGLFSYLARAASVEGHVQPYGTFPVPMAPQPAGTVPPQTPYNDPSASHTGSSSNQNDSQVNS